MSPDAFLEAVPCRRDRVALTTAYATGLRASEVVGLRNQHIDSSRMVIHVINGKGGKQRYVMLAPKLLGILRAYWDIERPRRPWLFPGRVGDIRAFGESSFCLVMTVGRRVGEDVATPTPHSAGRADFPLPVLHGKASLTAVYRWMIRGAGRGCRVRRSLNRSHGNRLPRRDSHFRQILATL